MTRRLLLSYLTVTLVVLVLLELPLAVFFQQRELDRLTVDAERDATVLATIYEDSLEQDLPADPTPADDYSVDTAARVVVVDVDGISVVDTAREIDRDFSTRPEIDVALTGERSTGTRRSDTLDTDLLFVAVPVASGGTVHGALRITLGTEEVTERIWKFWLGLIGIAVVILTVMAGVGWIIARSITRPIRRLEATATRFSGGDLTPTDPDANAPHELVALEVAMNDMASRLDELIERQRAFVADASHQLRTPLTALRLRLENLQFDNPTDAQELDDAIDETTRLAALVDDLLRLARTENSLPPVDVNLTELIRDRVDVWTATAEQNQISLELVASGNDVHASVTPGGIEQVLDNLLDNAFRAAPEGSSVVVTITDGTTDQTIAIADGGPGLSDDDKDQALNRFWRSDDSIPGTGLGLAIVDTILQASGGSIELSDNTPTGLVATITLPAP
ncbi:MAG: two-component sensor histidine kinase [Actinobacteria bacterium]|nr:MAG: two-component sensor histidine kinase [Actinomycetota bacterium]